MNTSSRRKSKHRRSVKWKFLVLIVLLLVGVRLAMPYAIHHEMENRLAELEGFDGSVDKVSLQLIKGAYTIEGLRIVKIGGAEPIPFLTAQKLEISLQWSEIFNGALVGEMIVHEPNVFFVKAPSPEESIEAPPPGWDERLEELFPMRFNRFQVRDATVHYRDATTDPTTDIYVDRIFANAVNLANTEDLLTDRPSSVDIIGRPMGDARLRMHLDLNPFAELPNVEVTAQVTDMDLTTMNDFLRHHGNFDVHRGTLDLYAEFLVTEGHFKGYVRPFLENVDVVRWDEDLEEKGLLQTLYESAVGVAADILESPKDKVATRVPIEGDLEDPDVATWAVVWMLVRNAFIESLVPGIEGFLAAGDKPTGSG